MVGVLLISDSGIRETEMAFDSGQASLRISSQGYELVIKALKHNTLSVKIRQHLLLKLMDFMFGGELRVHVILHVDQLMHDLVHSGVQTRNLGVQTRHLGVQTVKTIDKYVYFFLNSLLHTQRVYHRGSPFTEEVVCQDLEDKKEPRQITARGRGRDNGGRILPSAPRQNR